MTSPTDVPWNRVEQVASVRDRIWRYVSPAAGFLEEVQPEAAALLQLGELDLRHLGRLHFLLSEEVGTFLASLPRLTRRLATTTVAEEEWSLEHVRGTIEWTRTFGARAATGLPHLYVTAPARRAYQTPENELLAFVLDTISTTGRETRLAGAKSGVGREVADRVETANSWRRRRAITGIERRPPTPRTLARVRSGRHRMRYRSALHTYARFFSLCVELDPAEIRRLVEERALADVDDPVLFEIVATLHLIEALEQLGWKISPLRLFGAPRRLRLKGHHREDELTLWYQHTPEELARDSRYARVLSTHGIAPDWVRRRPDIVIHLRRRSRDNRWILVEMKLGLRRRVRESARAALADLLSYRRDFEAALEGRATPYGLGIAWGAGLEPTANSEVVLTTPDRLVPALELLLE